MQPDETPPVKRGRDGRRMNPASLANLQPGAGAGRVGQAPALKHGAYTRSPQRSPDWSPAVTEAARDLAGRVGQELLDDDGGLLPWAVPSVEAVALQRVAALRLDRSCADLELRGKLKPRDVVMSSVVNERYHRALEREALTLRSRIATQSQAVDLASLMSAQTEAERAAAVVDADPDLDLDDDVEVPS